jgi:hypothetical protein
MLIVLTKLTAPACRQRWSRYCLGLDPRACWTGRNQLAGANSDAASGLAVCQLPQGALFALAMEQKPIPLSNAAAGWGAGS